MYPIPIALINSELSSYYGMGLPSYDDREDDEGSNRPGLPEKRLWKSVIARAYSDIIYYYNAITEPTSGLYLPTPLPSTPPPTPTYYRELLTGQRNARAFALNAYRWFLSDKIKPCSFVWCITQIYPIKYHQSLVHSARKSIKQYESTIRSYKVPASIQELILEPRSKHPLLH